MTATNWRKGPWTMPAIALLLGILFDQLFFKSAPGASFPLYVLVALGCGWLVARNAGIVLPRRVWLLAVAAALSALFLVLRDSELLLMLDVLTTFYVMLWITHAIREPAPRGDPLVYYIQNAVVVPFRYLGGMFHVLENILHTAFKVKMSPHHEQIIRGLILALPLAAIFIGLFASADIVFNEYLTTLFDLNIEDETIIRFIEISFVTAFFIGALGYATEVDHAQGNAEEAEKDTDQRKTPTSLAGRVEGLVVLSCITSIFLIFIFVQVNYLFGGADNIERFGYTYAQYARKGFFELIAVAVIAFAVMWWLERAGVRDGWSTDLKFRLLMSGLVLQVMVVIASSFKRLLLYENAYGFTVMRLYSHLFTAVLTVIFLLFLYKIWRTWSDDGFILAGFVCVAAFLIPMNAVNLEEFIVEQNLMRYERTGDLDVQYLSTLSADPVPLLYKAFNGLEGEKKAELGGLLYARTEALARFEGQDWRSYNYSRTMARKLLTSHAGEFKRYKDQQPVPYWD